MTSTSEQQAVPVAQEVAIVAVTQADRDAVQAFHRKMLDRLMSDVKSQRPKLGDDEGDAGTLVQAFARHRLASLPCKSGQGAGAMDWSEAQDFVDRYDLPQATVADLAKPVPDATQTREAELVAAFRKAAQGYGRAGTADLPGGPDMSMDDAAEVYARLSSLDAELVAAAQEAHDTLHGCTAVLFASDCKKVAATMSRLRAALNSRGGA